MSRDSGGERDSLAPVIPLFGGPVPQRPEPAPFEAEFDEPDDELDYDELARGHDPQVEAAWSRIREVLDRNREDESSHREPPRIGAVEAPSAESARPAWHPTWSSDRVRRESGTADEASDRSSVDLAEKALLKKLRTRSLSISEARGVLREHDLDEAAREGVLASLEEYGYLDDAALAEQLVHAGVDRKGQGRQAIAQTLAKRGIPRDVADAALAALPDDDLERALEFARSKARGLSALDRDVALRRLSGQLARRGYPGSVAAAAAKAALDEHGGGASGVRFR